MREKRKRREFSRPPKRKLRPKERRKKPEQFLLKQLQLTNIHNVMAGVDDEDNDDAAVFMSNCKTPEILNN